jgi:lipopolysaccharide transport system permease protein
MSTTEAVRTPPRVTVIDPARRRFSFELRELWQFRELLFFLIWRDIKVRYKQTALGVAWAVIQPLVAMVIFSIIFGRFAKLPSAGLPYPVFVYAGLVPWNYFAASLSQASMSIVGNQNLVTKVYLPRLIIPVASVGVPVIDFAIALIVLIGLMFGYGIAPTWHIVYLPVFLLMALCSALGIGLWLATLNVRYRDIPYVIPFLTQIWMYASPIIYPVTLVPARWQWVLSLNPMTGVIEGFRWSLLGQTRPSLTVMLVSAIAGLALTVSGLWYFKHVERRFADVI